MFKNKDGSYNRASVAITLFVIGVICAMTFSYIMSNVTLPEIKFDMPTPAPQEIVPTKSPIVETVLVEPVIQTQGSSQPITFPEIGIPTYLIMGAVIAIFMLMFFVRSTSIVPMIISLVMGAITLMIAPLILNSVMSSIPTTSSSAFSSTTTNLTTTMGSAFNMVGLFLITIPVMVLLYYFSNIISVGDMRDH